MAIAAVKPNTRQSIPSPTNIRLPSVVKNAISPRLSSPANTAPSVAPSRASSVLSESNCLISLPRAAPIACRTAISRSRTLARASSRFARFAQAISSTSPVVASRIQRGCSYSRRNCETPVPPGVTVSLLARYFLASSAR